MLNWLKSRIVMGLQWGPTSLMTHRCPAEVVIHRMGGALNHRERGGPQSTQAIHGSKVIPISFRMYS